MSNQRYSPEFKDAAVRQIDDRGYSVAEVSERLGGSAHSLYKWVKAIKPDKTDEQAAPLVEARSEVLKLRAQWKRAAEERDIPKKGRKVLGSKPRVKYPFIQEHRSERAVQRICRLLEVSPSGHLRVGSTTAVDRQRSCRRWPSALGCAWVSSDISDAPSHYWPSCDRRGSSTRLPRYRSPSTTPAGSLQIG